MIESKQNAETGTSIDDRIREHREAGKDLLQGTSRYEKWAADLDALYKEKSVELKRVALSEREDPAAGFEPPLDDRDPETGLAMTEGQRQARAELEQLRGDLVNAYGTRAVEAIADHLIGDLGPFKDVDALESFIRSSNLDAKGQREAVMALGEVAKALDAPGPEIDHAQALKATGSQLQTAWGERFESEIDIARQTAKQIFGSVANWDLWATRHGLTRNPTAQVRAVLALAQLGRRIKGGRS